MTERVQLWDLLTAELPTEWLDVSEELPPGSPPTLARADGVGALQFSFARYESGECPSFASDLRELLEGFGAPRGLGELTNAIEARGVLPYARGDFASDDEFIRVWYMTNGKDLVLATYVVLGSHVGTAAAELEEASRIVASVDF